MVIPRFSCPVALISFPTTSDSLFPAVFQISFAGLSGRQFPVLIPSGAPVGLRDCLESENDDTWHILTALAFPFFFFYFFLFLAMTVRSRSLCGSNSAVPSTRGAGNLIFFQCFCLLEPMRREIGEYCSFRLEVFPPLTMSHIIIPVMNLSPFGCYSVEPQRCPVAPAFPCPGHPLSVFD